MISSMHNTSGHLVLLELPIVSNSRVITAYKVKIDVCEAIYA